MTPPVDKRKAFAHTLRRLVPQGELRAVARRLDPQNPERGKRNLNRYIAAKVLPSAPMVAALEDAIPVERGTLAAALEDKDEEEDLDARLLAVTRELSSLRRELRTRSIA